MRTMPRRTCPVLPIAVGVAALVWAPAALGWVPDDCDQRPEELGQLHGLPTAEAVRAQWAKYQREVRTAPPGSALYAPKPFPRTESQIIEDFRYAYFEKLFDEGPALLSPSERVVYEGLESGAVEIEIERVENWGVSRCGSFRPLPFYYLLRLFDGGSRELARATILPSGLLGEYAQVTEVAAAAFTGLAQLAARVQNMTGRVLVTRRPQYAAVDGLPLHCGPLAPCVVFEAEGKSWILARGALLYEIRAYAPARSVLEHREIQRASGVVALGPSNPESPVVSRGFGWVEASLVGRDAALARAQGLDLDR